MTNTSKAPGTTGHTNIEVSASRNFATWLKNNNCSLLFTTYQAGHLFMVGLNKNGQVSAFKRNYNRCMGLGGDSDGFYMSSIYQIWHFTNMLKPGELYQDFDRVYVPRVCYITGDLDTHDIGVDKANQPIFVNTLYSCLATVSQTASFKATWKPKFISKLAAEDRCHLNGLAMEDGQPKFVSAVSITDVHTGWRDHRNLGGVIISVETDEIICQNLSMPHSPRLYQGKLWCLNSGRGDFGYIDMEKGNFEVVTFCPGYARGLSFIDHYAIIGLSINRPSKNLPDLAIDDRLKKYKQSPRCGLMIVDLRSGDCVHSFHIHSMIDELYDVLPLQGVTCPMALGFVTDEIRQMISIDPNGIRF